MSNFDWPDVAAQMVGNWQNAIMALNGLDLRQYKPNHHYPCPMCGGKDRFRFDDRKPKSRRADGSGGYFCNACGGGDGMMLLRKLTGMSFSEAVNELGKFLNMQPVEIRRAASQAIHSAKEVKYGKEMPTADAAAAMERTRTVETCPLTMIEGICPSSLRVVFRKGEAGNLKDPNAWRVAVPMNRVNRDGTIGALCNVALLDIEGYPTFAAGAVSFDAGHFIRGNHNIVLCERWVDGWHVHHQTGATVIVCFTPQNIDHVAYLLDSVAGIAAHAADIDTLAYADERQVKVWVMKGKKVVGQVDAERLLKKRPSDGANTGNAAT